MTPNFSAFPWERLPRLSRRDANAQSLVARWIGARSSSVPRLRALVGAESIDVRVVSSSTAGSGGGDPHAAVSVIRVVGAAGGAVVYVRLSSAGVRAIAQRLLGGPAELSAPRPLGVVEQAIASLVVATVLEDLGVDGQVWPSLGSAASVAPASSATSVVVELDTRLGDITLAIELSLPSEVHVLRAPPMAARPRWAETLRFDLPLVAGRCAIHRDDLERLALRTVVTLERPASDSERGRFRAPREVRADLDVLDGAIGLRGEAGALVATVATGYVRRDMSMPDDAHVELTVAVGTAQLTLRQVLDLSVGEIVTLGRPLAGPFEVRTQGRVLGRGELVDVDGELAVRIVSLGD